MKSHLLIAWAALFLFSCVSLCSVQEDKHTEISKFPFIESLQMRSSIWKFYRLDLTNAPTDLYLTISVFPEKGSYVPKLFVSQRQDFPRSSIDVDYRSHTLSAGSSVFISPDELKNIPSFLYIGLYCESECKGNIFAESSTIEIMPTHSQIPPQATHKLLSPNTPFYGVVNFARYHYFEALLVSGSSITISIQSNAEWADLFISTDPNNKYPDQNSFTHTTKTSITLTSEACRASKSLACSVYISVFSIEVGKESLYLLSLRRNSTSESPSPAIALEDDREIPASIAANNKIPAIFYYTTSQNSIVKVRCPGREVVIYARRLRVDINPLWTEYINIDISEISIFLLLFWRWFRTQNEGVKSLTKPHIGALNKDTAEISSLDNQNNLAGIASIFVPLLADSEVTIVAISVYFNEIQPKSLTTRFTILASSQITQLFTGTPYSGYVPQDHYVYFIVPIMRSETTLLVSLTNLDDEGDADLVISYGSNLRPTISDYQFASISNSKAHMIEINNTDIAPGTSMSGNWVIGVYGRKASSFSLAAAYEDQKLVDLIPGTPVEMSLNESSSVNFKFLHQSKTNVQIVLTTFVGELNFYMTSLDSTQNLASNLPYSVNFKWQILQAASPSFINIPVQDPRACVSCLYIISIEAIRSSSFRLIVNEGYSFVPLQDEIPYSGHLRPQESAPFLFRSSTNAEEAQLRIDREGSELEVFVSHDPLINITNYLWKEAIPFDSKNSHIVSLKKNQDPLYILFYNPANTDTSYNFTMTFQSSNTILLDGFYKQVHINSYEKVSFLYYSNIVNQDQITLDFILYVEGFEENRKVKYMESALSQGQVIKGRYWPEEETPGPGQEVHFEKLALDIEHQYNQIRGKLSMANSMGKFLIEIANPWEFPVRFGIEVRTSMHGFRVLGENLQYEDYSGEKIKSYEIFMTKAPAKWYFWVYACHESVDLKIETANKETQLAIIPQGGSYLYKENIEKKGIEDRFKYMTAKRNYGTIYVYSSLVDEEKLWDYEVPKEKDLEMKSWSYNYEKMNSQVTVEFDPVEFKDPDPTDKVKYSIEICNYYSDVTEVNFCRSIGCPNSELEFSVNHKEPITVNFERVKDGEHYVKIKASVVHRGHVIRFVPYAVDYVEVKSRFWWNFSAVVIGGIIEIIIFALCYRKMKSRWRKERND